MMRVKRKTSTIYFLSFLFLFSTNLLATNSFSSSNVWEEEWVVDFQNIAVSEFFDILYDRTGTKIKLDESANGFFTLNGKASTKEVLKTVLGKSNMQLNKIDGEYIVSRRTTSSTKHIVHTNQPSITRQTKKKNRGNSQYTASGSYPRAYGDLTIKRIETDLYGYAFRSILLENVEIDVDSYYNYGYNNAQGTHYSFEIKDKTGRGHVYGLKSNKYMRMLREEILSKGKPQKCSVKIVMKRGRFSKNQSDVLAELVTVYY